MRVQTQLSPAIPQSLTTLPATDRESEQGCGWFDSSYELSQGLVVTEGDDSTLAQLWVAALFLHSTPAGQTVCH